MTRLIPGEKLDEATRKSLRDLLRAVAGDTSPSGSQLAGERIKVLAPRGEVTVELVTFIDRVLAMAVPHCPRCLDVSIGLCNPCRPEHAAELQDAIRGITLGDPTLPPPAVPMPMPETASERAQSSIDAECFSKKRYATPDLAHKVAKRAEQERGAQLRVYACTVEGCGGFHITSKPRRAA